MPQDEHAPPQGSEASAAGTMSKSRMLILCDFDGTVTERDVTDLVWDPWIPRAERERMVGQVVQRNWTMYQYIAHGYGHVRSAPDQILSELDGRVAIRRGWQRFIACTSAAGANLHIVSNGLDFYIRQYVPASIQVACFSAHFDGSYRVELPAGCTLGDGEDFKVNRARKLIAEYGDRTVVYVGDGRADFEPALL